MGGGFAFDDSEDEEQGVGDERGRRRDGLSLSMDARGIARSQSSEDVSDRRLSRELEEGFADDSDAEEEEVVTTRHYG